MLNIKYFKNFIKKSRRLVGNFRHQRLPFIIHFFYRSATIFMLHRVAAFERGRLFANENMKVTPPFLEEFIVSLKSKGFQFISLDDLHQLLLEGKSFKKKIVLTLDDGYKDNFLNAYPIFKKHQVPFAIYITTGLIEGKLILWWYLLEDLIIANDKVVLSNGLEFDCKSKLQKENVFLQIRQIILEQSNMEKVKDLFSHYDISQFANHADYGMSWEQVMELSKDELATIGGHTVNHLPMKQLSEEEIIAEVTKANQLIESKINKKVEHFAYPFGDKFTVGEREIDLFRDKSLLTFKTATSTRIGNVRQKHKNSLHCLPRIMLMDNRGITNG